MRQLSFKQININSGDQKGPRNQLKKRELFVKRAGAAPSVKIQTDKNVWQKLNEGQRQWKSRQIIKSLYGNISQKELYITSKKAKNSPNVVSKLETRLDILVYRLQFATSISEAREFIKKGFILVNNKVVKYPGYFVLIGSLIKSTNLLSIKARLRQKDIPFPSYLLITSPLTGVLLHYPIYDSSQGPLKFFHRYTLSLC